MIYVHKSQQDNWLGSSQSIHTEQGWKLKLGVRSVQNADYM